MCLSVCVYHCVRACVCLCLSGHVSVCVSVSVHVCVRARHRVRACGSHDHSQPFTSYEGSLQQGTADDR